MAVCPVDWWGIARAWQGKGKGLGRWLAISTHRKTPQAAALGRSRGLGYEPTSLGVGCWGVGVIGLGKRVMIRAAMGPAGGRRGIGGESEKRLHAATCREGRRKGAWHRQALAPRTSAAKHAPSTIRACSSYGRCPVTGLPPPQQTAPSGEGGGLQHNTRGSMSKGRRSQPAVPMPTNALRTRLGFSTRYNQLPASLIPSRY